VRPINTILLTTDFSATSATAFAAARELAKAFGSRIILLYVEAVGMAPVFIEGSAYALDEVMRIQQEAAPQRLADFANKHVGEGPDVQCEVAVGAPHVEIVRMAEERDVDLIVMATHGRGFISHAVLGSTTERVIRRAPCPVFVVRERS